MHWLRRMAGRPRTMVMALAGHKPAHFPQPMHWADAFRPGAQELLDHGALYAPPSLSPGGRGRAGRWESPASENPGRGRRSSPLRCAGPVREAESGSAPAPPPGVGDLAPFQTNEPGAGQIQLVWAGRGQQLPHWAGRPWVGPLPSMATTASARLRTGWKYSSKSTIIRAKSRGSGKRKWYSGFRVPGIAPKRFLARRTYPSCRDF